eukprot:CAMPEP_0113933956 /NCGR_PEP_ID=MMETSP1339-20121228/1309_1 /TAXON_ID=94617 /ORGANISM="Fibrocapsa japonica" /LENGTH=88 /DNA_ID=CAMNT_0000935543 /DNA_START=219 /DNA_END=485 /DNA_ORIENTATION=+ /assembly_acc=CAM_ASM_000762
MNARSLMPLRMADDTLERVQKVVVEQLSVDAGQVTSGANFVNDLGCDSLDLVEMVMAFEEEFGITVDEEVQAEIQTVEDAVRVINDKL